MGTIFAVIFLFVFHFVLVLKVRGVFLGDAHRGIFRSVLATANSRTHWNGVHGLQKFRDEYPSIQILCNPITKCVSE